ncbi:isocitrate lyase/PEP mutase family protein [Roseomonas populi]|uniref:Isocitrate lyase/PEP mutase family protein n=1 Tax=Roseomonas populi TaxID=3121582 RepID=A0ABT1XCP6_9PROT|nr:isocitrate lyase/PEP mutase family protein [Roseomonas pecuniae]MCR0984902.1 isocitrate lyase/PEP mutase family protein [Roseomonas pecuniae]
MPASHVSRLIQLLAERRAVLTPGVANALTARVVETLGFEAAYLTGAGLTNTFLGLPDLGFMDLTQLAQHLLAIREATELPVVVDADTGFGNALNVGHAVRLLERAGASAIQIEDQLSPKRCGHFAGKALVSAGEMSGKIRAAADGRRDGVLIVARTDAIAVEGFEAAIDRAGLYAEAGADILFVEAPTGDDELRRIPRLLPRPQMLNLVVGGMTPMVGQAEAAEMGFGLLLYANVALQGAVQGMRVALEALQRDGRLDEASGLTASFAERQALVRKPWFDEQDRRYGDAA